MRDLVYSIGMVWEKYGRMHKHGLANYSPFRLKYNVVYINKKGWKFMRILGKVRRRS